MPTSLRTLLIGLREHFKDALPSIEAEGARWIPRRACGTLHGRDKRSVRRSRWRAMPMEQAPPISICGESIRALVYLRRP